MTLSKQHQRLAVVTLLLSWCIVLLLFRAHLAFSVPDDRGGRTAIGLMWNLFLASIPLMWSSAFQAASAGRRPILASLYFFLWLLFLPNAPYILTDLIHLNPRPHVPLWYLLAMLLSCAGTGTLLGYLSLIDVHAAVEGRFGKAMGWAIAAGSLMLCGFGIYLGRFLRWNSWDAFTNPIRLSKSIVGQFIDSGSHPSPIAVTLIFGVGLIVGYIALRGVATAMHPEVSQER